MNRDVGEDGGGRGAGRIGEERGGGFRGADGPVGLTGEDGSGGDRGGDGSAGAGREGSEPRPVVTELRLSAFRSFRGARLRLGALTVCTGPSGGGKSTVLEALAVLAGLAGGQPLRDVLDAVPGGPVGCVPLGTVPDDQGRRGIRLGCTVSGPVGPVRLDLAVQVEPELRFVGERLTGAGEVLLETALRDPRGSSVQAAWHTAGRVPVTRAPLPDDRLASALLPLRVAGRTPGQLLVLAAVEQLVVALRGVFRVDPEPRTMRDWVPAGNTMLEPDARNVSAVVARTLTECRVRHGLLGEALRAVCPYRVDGVTVVPGTAGTVMAALDRGPLGGMPVTLLGAGELRALALSLVLLTGPGVLAMDPAEVPGALQLLTVAAEDLDRGLAEGQVRELLALAGRMCARGHVRVVASAHHRAWVEGTEGVTVIPLPLR